MRRLLLALLTGLALGPAMTTTAWADSPGWTIYDYNTSGHQITARNSPHSMPATTTDGTASFQFIPGTYTALLVTKDASLTGDLSQKTVTDTVSWSGTGAFRDQNGGGCIPDLQSVRLYLESPSAAGQSVGSPPAAFYTQFWWTNPANVQLSGDAGGGTITASLTWPAAAHQWSDWDGKGNADSAELTQAFIEATQNVKTIGLSFGGGCFFENGVTTMTGGTFASTFSEA